MSNELAIDINKVRIPSESQGSLPYGAPSGSALNAQTLFDWLGSFWSTVYEDPEFIQDMQEGRALRVSQLYLDLLENLKLQDRENAPVFHRERWHPIILRHSWRNQGSKSMVQMTPDGSVKMGVQDSEIYEPGTVLTIGGKNVNYSGMVVYPLTGASSGLLDALTCATNNIIRTSVVLGKGTDFAILDGAIAFAAEQDPFTGEHADEFPKFEVVAENPEDNDVETVVWVCDALFDKNFIYTALGYAIGLPGASSEIYKRVVNAAWNATASGATPLLVRSLVAGICGVPTVKEEGETVTAILEDVDGSIEVVTDKNVYSLPKNAELRKDVRRGAKLHRFDTLDMAIRVYACTNDLDRLPEYNDFLDDLEDFKEDVPAIDLPPAFFRSDIEKGFSVNWDLQDVIYCGNDANDNPKLRFSLGGTMGDEDKFWSDTWASYERAGKSMETCLEGLRYDTIYTVGAVWTQISPMEFFMHNLLGANTLVITIRTDTLADDAPLYDPRFFGVLRESIPSYIRLYTIEHTAIGNDKAKLSTAKEQASMYAYSEYEDAVTYERMPKRGPKYSDKVSSKWVASCRGGHKGKDEEEDYD